MKIDINRPVKTRDGRPVTIISNECRLAGDGQRYPLIGYIGLSQGIKTWRENGCVGPCGPYPEDLVQELEMWVNVYDNGGTGSFHSFDVARDSVSKPIARIRVPYTAGQFDEPAP